MSPEKGWYKLPIAPKTVNTIFYCRHWARTVRFYRDRLRLPVTFAADWFVEFKLGPMCRMSLADEKRASIKSCGGRGVTLALEVDDIRQVHRALVRDHYQVTPIREHPWQAEVFYLLDPEGHRLEIWQRTPNPPSTE